MLSKHLKMSTKVNQESESRKVTKGKAGNMNILLYFFHASVIRVTGSFSVNFILLNLSVFRIFFL